MAVRTLHYADLNAQEVAGLDPAHTIALMAARPLLRRLGARQLAADLPALAMALGLVSARDKPTYIGEPRLATAEAGHRMLDAHVEEALVQLARAMHGRPPYSRPMLWSLRFIEGSERPWP